jgi:hypothetical protein
MSKPEWSKIIGSPLVWLQLKVTRLLEFAIIYTEIVKFYIVHIEPMNPRSGMNDNHNNIRKTKAIAAIPMAGIIVTAALVSGLVSLWATATSQP